MYYDSLGIITGSPTVWQRLKPRGPDRIIAVFVWLLGLAAGWGCGGEGSKCRSLVEIYIFFIHSWTPEEQTLSRTPVRMNINLHRYSGHLPTNTLTPVHDSCRSLTSTLSISSLKRIQRRAHHASRTVSTTHVWLQRPMFNCKICFPPEPVWIDARAAKCTNEKKSRRKAPDSGSGLFVTYQTRVRRPAMHARI